MKKRGLAICLAVLLCLTGIGARIWYVNKDREETVTEIYPMGEMVSFGESIPGFFVSEEERTFEIKPWGIYRKTIWLF